MAGVIAHARQLLDQLRDPRQRPQLRAVAVRERAAQQLRFELCELIGRQARKPAGTAGALEAFASRRAPPVVPAHHTLPADAQHTRDLGLALAALEHLRGAQPTLTHYIEVTRSLRHAGSIARTIPNVTVLCECL